MEYILHILTLIGIYTILAVSLGILAGQLGFLSLAHAAFYGLGAYTSALLAVHLGAPFLVGVVAGMVVASLVALVVALPTLRLHDDYFVIATFGFQMILFSVLNNWVGLTNGPFGIRGIPQPAIFGVTVQSAQGFLVLTAFFAALSVLIAYRIKATPFGRVLRAIREDEMLSQALGKNTLYFKIISFMVSAAMAAVAGSLYSHYITYIDPTSFTIMESVLLLSMVIIGGADSIRGASVGAAILIILPEALRFTGVQMSVAANIRQILYGVLLVLIVIFRPRGLRGGYDFGS